MKTTAQHKKQVVEDYNKCASTYEADEYAVDTSPNFLLERYAPLFDEFRILNPKKIIELGGGTGLFTAPLSLCLPKSEITVVDLSSGMLEELNEKIRSLNMAQCRAMRGDFDNLSFEDKMFDAALFSYSLHETLDPKVSIREAKRVLKKDGTLFILEIGGGAQQMDETQTFDVAKHKTQRTHVHYAEADEWEQMLTAANFKQVRSIPILSYTRHEPNCEHLEVSIYAVIGKK